MSVARLVGKGGSFSSADVALSTGLSLSESYNALADLGAKVGARVEINRIRVSSAIVSSRAPSEAAVTPDRIAYEPVFVFPPNTRALLRRHSITFFVRDSWDNVSWRH